MKTTSRARVIVTLDIPIGGEWSDGGTIEQINKQAREEALNTLRNAVIIDGLRCTPTGPPTIIANVINMRVQCIIVEDDK